MTPKSLLTPEEYAIKIKRAKARRYYRYHKAKARKYSEANKEKRRLAAAKWRLENRERYLKQQFRYDITKRGNLTTMERYFMIYRRTIKRDAEAKQGKGFFIE